MNELNRGNSINKNTYFQKVYIEDIKDKFKKLNVEDKEEYDNTFNLQENKSNLSKHDYSDEINNYFPNDLSAMGHLFHIDFMQTLLLKGTR